MTRIEVLTLAVGEWVQESLGGRRRGRARPQWGRPRQVVGVERTWKTRKGWAVHFTVRFGITTLHWTAVEDVETFKRVPEPTMAEIETWAERAERSPLVFKE